MLLDLLEEGSSGKVIIGKESRVRIDHQPVEAKLAGIGSVPTKEKLLGEIMLGQDVIKITNKHIILLDNNM